MNPDKSLIHTIGFTQKSAEEFFGLLRRSGTRCAVDVRLNKVSQLAGFSKKDDLAYFLREILGVDYLHLPLLAPTHLRAEQRGEVEHLALNRVLAQFLAQPW